jgi:hypothetical protein
MPGTGENTVPYSLSVTGRPDCVASADSIHGILVHARRQTLAHVGPEFLTVTITAPDGFCCPFTVSADADQIPAEVIEAMVDQVLWDVRAVLHYREDTAAEQPAHTARTDR